ncbi:YdcH family protein [Azospirillum sp.]|uniref:YdcH family protein n=1 Tax=Azospirillum sp. TaxID=34012 RepID=UPI003D74CAC1
MNKESHISALRQRHAELDTRIREAESHHSYDNVAVSRMKTEKLHLKEEIERLSH